MRSKIPKLKETKMERRSMSFNWTGDLRHKNNEYENRNEE